MTPEERPFTPDEIDTRIDHSSSLNAPPSSDQRLMQSLHALYSAEEQEMTSALERGRERLSQHLASLPTSQQRDGPASNVVPMFTDNQSAMSFPQEEGLRTMRWPLRLASLAAAVLLVALVGSLVAGLVLVRHNPVRTIGKPAATVQPSATPTSAQGQESLYLLTMPGFSIVKVDTTVRRVAWTYNWWNPTSQGGGAAFGALLVGNGGVYFSAGSAPADSDSITMSLHALDDANGTLLWQNRSLSNSSPLLAANGVVYMSTGTDLYALNASDGSTRWHTQVGSGVNKLILEQGVLYGTTFDTSGQWTSTLFAMNVDDGTLLWQSALPANKTFTLAAIVNGRMYLISGEEHNGEQEISYVYAYNLTGQQLWQSHPFKGFLSTPIIEDGSIYFTGDDARTPSAVNVYALRAKDGSLLWNYPIDAGMIISGGPAFANGTVYVESSPNSADGPVTNYLIALNGQNGHVRWKQKITIPDPGSGGFVLGNGFLYVVIPGSSITGVEAHKVSDGSLAWQTSVRGFAQLWPIAAP